ncbi:hypothetical protein MPTK1_5g11630 [Marchantia polymorpha subsp. ruderalis]|uniref:Uncharacterized protein n=2 Tax=Marchantia polymorpha TaxID=3197 RepID=A0AAF6BHC5_MARPO|nr:hypothetical protein MARPO_0093s0086 [Marchantia polymorpha]BBN11409.1 hypothetical protein Mp_5g11630 [Marchantia polymorpha subsp. ruderalis]|eukprot:PTQ33021.1 hypothetical protein MARPO_0093s0086 [Marchantia polymorpha]
MAVEFGRFGSQCLGRVKVLDRQFQEIQRRYEIRYSVLVGHNGREAAALRNDHNFRELVNRRSRSLRSSDLGPDPRKIARRRRVDRHGWMSHKHRSRRARAEIRDFSNRVPRDGWQDIDGRLQIHELALGSAQFNSCDWFERFYPVELNP